MHCMARNAILIQLLKDGVQSGLSVSVKFTIQPKTVAFCWYLVGKCRVLSLFQHLLAAGLPIDDWLSFLILGSIEKSNNNVSRWTS